MPSLALFADGESIKNLILIVAALLIAAYLWYLSHREKRAPAPPPPLTAERLRDTADSQLVDTVVADLLAGCDAARPDPYRQTALWANPQVNVYSVWVAVKELESAGFAAVHASPAGAFLPLAADGFAQMDAPRCEAAVRQWLSADPADEAAAAAAGAAFAEAVAAEDPLARCVPYIRDNAEAFVSHKDEPVR